jgi:hypothetical protein
MAQPPRSGASTRRVARVVPVAACFALLGALLTGCSSSPEEAAPPPSTPHQRPIVAPEPLPDTRHVALTRVGGTRGGGPVAVNGGDLVLSGSVRGPGGPVAGATVLLERFVGQSSGSLEVRTGADGGWIAVDVHGGRYRFRAWRTPDLAMAASELRFIAADAEVDLSLAVDRYDGADVTGDVDDDAPDVGVTVTVTALVTRQQVDGRGIITTRPASGRHATVTVFGPWRLNGSRSAVVDGAGRVRWAITCDSAGPVSARVEALGTEATVSATCQLPVVVDPPPEPPAPDFPIGASFTPPYGGPIPAGTYTVIADPGTCALTYEAWTGRDWAPARRTVTGTGVITIPEIARNLEALGDSPACTYERTT